MVTLPALLLAFTIHELCHGLMANWLGDDTAKRDGRLSLNPIKHIDPVGMLLLLIAGFGWAKPVIVNPVNFRNPKVDMALVAIAGPISNFIMAFIGLMILFPIYLYAYNAPIYLFEGLWIFTYINVLLGVFNLIPIPPLDGSKVIAGMLPDSIYYKLPPTGMFGMILLLILVFTGATQTIILPIVEAIHDTFLNAVGNIYMFFIEG